MPKKRASTYVTKPSSPAHSSLSSSGKPKDAPHSLISSTTPTGTSVNDRLYKLRIGQRSQTTRPSSEILTPSASPSLPPSLRNLLQIPDPPPPRPRPGLRVTGRVRGPAGPVPPSWLRRRDNGINSRGKLRPSGREGEARELEKLPDSFLPEEGSLIATTLKTLARNWDWNVQYNQYYLATIPVRYKEALLQYIARYSQRGIDRAGLQVLFLDETELEDGTGAEGLTHLDLATFIGNSVNFRELKDLFGARKATLSLDAESNALPESWDAPEVTSQPPALPRFQSLTHLSLSHPGPAATWKGLLDLAPHITTLTHLSLAYWPTPTLSPNSKTAYRETPQGSINYGASNFYSIFDNDLSEAASILRRLGKSTYCLKWLDLTGCYLWVQALAYEEIDWFGAWQGLDTVRIGQGWIPERFQENTHQKGYYALEVSPDQRREQEWASIERATLAVEQSVSARIVKAIKRDHDPEYDELRRQRKDREWDREWRHLPVDRPSPGYRSTKVAFERGWDAWWIEEAIEQITDRKSTTYAPAGPALV